MLQVIFINTKHYLERFEIKIPEQYGFRQKKSTVDVIHYDLETFVISR